MNISVKHFVTHELMTVVIGLGVASRIGIFTPIRACNSILTTSWPKGSPSVFHLAHTYQRSAHLSPRTQIKGLEVANLGGQIYTQIPQPPLSSSQNHCRPLCGCMQDFLTISRGVHQLRPMRTLDRVRNRVLLRAFALSWPSPWGCSHAHPTRILPG